MDYYKQCQLGNVCVDVVMLDDLINNIQFMSGDVVKSINDSVKLIVEIGQDVNNLLCQYVVFVSQWVVGYFNDEFKGVWVVWMVQMKVQVKCQEEVVEVIFNCWMYSVEQVLKVVQQYNILCSEMDVFVDQLLDLELFLLGRLMLQVRLENLQVVGLEYDFDYDQNCVMLSMLNVGLMLDLCFQIYWYLWMLEEFVKCDSLCCVFLMVMWGIVGVFIGVGVVLLCCCVL